MPLPLGVVATEGKATSPYWITSRTYPATTFSDTKVAWDVANNMYFVFCASNNVVVIKQSPRTGIIWQKTWAYATGCATVGLVVDNSQNIYIAVQIGSSNDVIKLDINGAGVWRRTLSVTTGTVSIDSILPDSNFDMIMICRTDITTTQKGMEIIKLSKNDGSIIWQTRYAHSNNGLETRCLGFTLDSSNNIYASAWWTAGTNQASGSVVKFNSAGVPQFALPLAVNAHSIPFNMDNVMVAADGSIYYSGPVSRTSTTEQRFRRYVKWNSAGTLQWNATINYDVANAGGNPQITGQATGIDSAGNFYTAGNYRDTTANRAFIAVHKWQTGSATPVWERRIEPGLQGLYTLRAYLNLINNNKTYFAIPINYGTGTASPSTGTPGYFKIPTDGTGTGTYNLGGVGWIYSSASLTRTTETLPTNNLLQTTGAAGVFVNTNTLPTITDGTQTIYSTLINV